MLRAVVLGIAVALVTVFGLAAYGMFDATSDDPGSRPVPTPWAIVGIATALGSAAAFCAVRERRSR
jgi:drug/metabolite transporter (DMT)-like permease